MQKVNINLAVLNVYLVPKLGFGTPVWKLAEINGEEVVFLGTEKGVYSFRL